MESTVALKQNSVPDKNMILYKLGNLRALISIGCQVEINLEITSKAHPSVYRVKFIMLIKKVILVPRARCVRFFNAGFARKPIDSHSTHGFFEQAILTNQNCMYSTLVAELPFNLRFSLLISCEHDICNRLPPVHKYHLVHSMFLSWISVSAKCKNSSNEKPSKRPSPTK